MSAANKKPLLTAEPVWQQLQKYYNENAAKINIKELFDQDAKRFEKFRWVTVDPVVFFYTVDIFCTQ